MGPLSVEILQDAAGFSQLEPGWQELLCKLGERSSPFLTPFWYHCWWRHFADGATLKLMVVREGDATLGIFPLMQRRLLLHGVPVSCLAFPENGNSLHNDLLVDPSRRKEVLATLVDALQTAGGWDVIQLNNLPLSSPNRALLTDLLLERGVRHQFRPSFSSPFLEMEGDWESFLAKRPGKVRKSIRRVLHQVESAGPWEVREVRQWEEFLSAWEEVRQVAERSWTHAIGDSLATPVNASFFRELAQGAAALGGVSLWLLLISGRAVAFEFHLRRGGTEYAMRASYDRGVAELSPGTFLETQMLKALFQGGGEVRRLDFGGSFNRYKKRWCEKAVPHVCLTIFGGSMLGRLAAFHELKTVRVLRSLRDRMRDRWQPAAQREEI